MILALLSRENLLLCDKQGNNNDGLLVKTIKKFPKSPIRPAGRVQNHQQYLSGLSRAIFPTTFLEIAVCTKWFAYLLCWPRGRGVALACTRRFSFHEFYNFLPFDFLILFFFWKTFFLPTTFTHTHTHDPRPLPTTHDPRHLATLVILASHNNTKNVQFAEMFLGSRVLENKRNWVCNKRNTSSFWVSDW